MNIRPELTAWCQGSALFFEINSEVKQAIPTFDPSGNSFADNQTVGTEMNVCRCLPRGLWKMNSARKISLLNLISKIDDWFK